nr:succinate dehydrogenase assembly factor 2 [Caulobacter sp. NIBR2454]
MPMDDVRLKKIRFRAWHRGFREADLILGPFADNHVHLLTLEQLDRLEALMEENDHDIYGWIIGRFETPPAFDHDVMDMLKTFRFEAFAARGEGQGA